MRVTARLVFVLYILFCTMVMAQEVKKKDNPDANGNMTAKSATFKPVLTAEQKLEIRTAQVQMFQAKSVLESTPQYQAFVQAQNKMNEIALRIQRASGADPQKWQFTQDLDYVAIPQPEPVKPTEKK